MCVGAPLAVLRLFFRSEWAPQWLKNLVGAVLSAGLLVVVGVAGWSWQAGHARRQDARRPTPPPVRLTVRQPGLLPYSLGRGGIEQARFDTVRVLVVSGDMPDGRKLRARFAAGSGAARPNDINLVAVSAEDELVPNATGRAVYAPDSQTVRGEFRCVLPSGKRLAVSFPLTPVGRRYGR